jgi:GNAT superfamily N-acetyltransferase
MAAARDDFDIVQSFIDFSLAWLEDRGYALTVDTDLSNWAACVAASSADAFVNPAFDPRFSRLSAADSFWLDIRVGSHTIAICAARLFVTDDFLTVMRSQRLWQDEPPPQLGTLAITAPCTMPAIAGHVGHEGGLWVHPEHRKRGLSVILPHLARALSARQWNVDWQTGVTRQAIGECGIAIWAYGMRHVEPCFDGYFPLTQSRERLYLAYVDREELIAGLDLDAVAGLLPDRHEQSRYPRALVQKG